MSKQNPYFLSSGVELDEKVHLQVFGLKETNDCPDYSVSQKMAERVRVKLVKRFKIPIVFGETSIRTRDRRFFARWETDPSTSTEVLAESIPLAICRLAILITDKHK